MQNAECTVLVCSCDKYADLLDPFCSLWRKFWPDCPFDVALVTETAPVLANSVFSRILAQGAGGTWCSRLVKAIDSVDTPYILMLCDDYYLEHPVDTELILKRFEQMKKFNACNLRMIPNPPPTADNSSPYAETDLFEYRKGTAYCVATQSGFWEKGFLKRLASATASIWEFERYGSYALEDETRPLLVTRTKEFPFVDAVHKGYWETWGVDVCRKNGVDVDFAKRGLPPFSVRFKEGVKRFIWKLNPELVTRLQNRFAIGAKEKGGKNEHPTEHRQHGDVGRQDINRGLHRFSARREQTISDCRRVGMLAKAMHPQPGGAADTSTNDQIRALIELAKKSSLYVPAEELHGLGEPISKRTGESTVYWNAEKNSYYKVKNPTAKQAIKHTETGDWFYEHVIHNILFPETSYEFMGITQIAGELCIILRQDAISSETFPSEQQISDWLHNELGLIQEDRYFFGNEVLSITDTGSRSDNVLLADDGSLRFIDPLIKLKKPALDVIAYLVGELPLEDA